MTNSARNHASRVRSAVSSVPAPPPAPPPVRLRCRAGDRDFWWWPDADNSAVAAINAKSFVDELLLSPIGLVGEWVRRLRPLSRSARPGNPGHKLQRSLQATDAWIPYAGIVSMIMGQKVGDSHLYDP